MRDKQGGIRPRRWSLLHSLLSDPYLQKGHTLSVSDHRQFTNQQQVKGTG